jgi:hypothetical protein
MIKKYIFGAVLALALPLTVAYAATPLFSASAAGNNTSSVQITGGEINAPVVLYYFNPGTGIYQGYSLGTTDANGTFVSSLNTSAFANLNANLSMPVYVQVGGYESARIMWPYTTIGSSANGGVAFSNSSPNMAIGQTGTVTLSGGSGNYYIASNSNSNNVSPSISGNTLNLYGSAAGQSTITVCSTGGGCGTLTTTTAGSGSPTLSTSNLTVTSGGQGSVTLSGGSGPYTVSMVSGTGVSTTLIGNTLFVNGNATGTNMLNICSSNGSCTPLSVNVQAQSTGGQIAVTVPLTMGKALSLALSGGAGGGYYLQSPVSSPALASITGNTLTLNGSAFGSGSVTVCQSGGSSCLPINFTVAPAAQAQTSLTGTGGGWLFDFDISIGMSGQAVLELQKRLMEEGYFNVTPTGYFGSITASAVMKYQAAHGVPTTGYVGPRTRAELNR